jgi:endonuclease/exonuclease/phosphatase family metal-dependent hydrolase
MSRATVWTVLFALMWLDAASTPRAQTALRVLTYNIHHGEGLDGQFDFVRLANIISGARPDLVALQEVDSRTERAGGVDELAELGRLTGMYAAFGQAMDFQGGSYGVAVLSRWPMLTAENHPLPGSPDREPRTSLTVTVNIGESGLRLQFTSTHLDQGRDGGSRVAQANDLNQQLVHGEDGPTILAGDMNSGADTEAIRVLDAQWTNVSPSDPTPSPSGRPRYRVDYVLVRPADRWRVLESSVVDAPIASDHRPVLVVLEWQGPR